MSEHPFDIGRAAFGEEGLAVFQKLGRDIATFTTLEFWSAREGGRLGKMLVDAAALFVAERHKAGGFEDEIAMEAGGIASAVIFKALAERLIEIAASEPAPAGEVLQ